jgi:SAM-dependent methyltransferase
MTPALAANHQYLLNKCISEDGPAKPRILDFGCGAGEVIAAGRSMGIEIFGAEVFYEGGDTRAEIEKKGLMDFVGVIEHGIIPFPDDFFDCVISNQVFEHIQNIDEMLREIHRVLKPGGKFFAHFPSRECFREGHCGVPFLHRFPKNSPLRYSYAVVMRGLGFGYFKGDKSVTRWVEDFLAWLDTYTFYRDKKEISVCFGKYFEISFIEYEYVAYRMKALGIKPLSAISQSGLVRPISSGVFRRLSGVMIASYKPLKCATDAAS